jgi:hypothetical protein
VLTTYHLDKSRGRPAHSAVAATPVHQHAKNSWRILGQWLHTESVDLTLGVVAHRGGLLVRRPELTVGVVQAVSRPSGLRIELIARRPVDRRDTTERQRDIRFRRDWPLTATPRVLLPEFDEGEDLRLGWLDEAGCAHWELPTSLSSWTGDSYEGFDGPSWRLAYDLPPLFDEVSIVLAWPEIGFGESVVKIALPDRATVDRATTSIWEALFDALPVSELSHHDAAHHAPMPVETGTVVAAPQLLHRDHHTAVALTRVTAIGSALCLELLGVATGPRADQITGHLAPPSQPGVPSLAVILDHDAFRIPPHESMASGANHLLTTTQELTFDYPTNGPLDLLVAWPAAEMPITRARISLDR